MRRRMHLPLALAFTLAFAASADAQVRFGAQADYSGDFDLGVGARAVFGLGSMIGQTEGLLADLQGVASFDFYFPDCGDCSFFEVNANGVVPLQLEGSPLAPYVGGGLHFYNFSFDSPFLEDAGDSGVGLNLVGGTYFGAGSLNLFGEAKLGLGGAEHFVLTVGVLFGGGGS